MHPAQRKAANPQYYCPVCLWRVETPAGRTPCPTHQRAEIDAILAESATLADAVSDDAESLVPLLQASIAIAKGEAQ